MEYTESYTRQFIITCITEYYKRLREQEKIGKTSKDELRTLKKLKTMYNLSMWMGLTNSEMEKIFCFISECRQNKFYN
jgi:predicted nucleic acid-binding protein